MEGIMELLFTRCCKHQGNTRCWKGGARKTADRRERQLILPSVFLLGKILQPQWELVTVLPSAIGSGPTVASHPYCACGCAGRETVFLSAEGVSGPLLGIIQA